MQTSVKNFRTQSAFLRPNGFEARSTLVYRTLDRETAYRYAKWSTLRSDGQMALLHVQIFESVIQSMNPYVLQDDE